MSETFAREILRRNIAQICQTVGWSSINSSPLDILVHVLEKYIRTVGTQANRYAEQFNRTEPNLHDLGLVFQDLNVNLPEIVDYTRHVPPVPPPVNVEHFPKPKESNLNFLKPGSHEVVTRPMHVHEHLPPMFPEKERDTPVVADTVEIQQNGIDSHDGITSTTCTSPEISVTDSPEKPRDIFKRPSDPISLPNSKRPRLQIEQEERTREISSVMMTMSGFLSPAREGKLPEARLPTFMSQKHHDKHKINSHHTNLTKLPIPDKSDKKSKKNKLLNGKIMKSKKKDKSHKSESSKNKDASQIKSDQLSQGYPVKNKDIHPTIHNHVTMPAPKITQFPPKSTIIPSHIPSASTSTQYLPDSTKAVIKQEPVECNESLSLVDKNIFHREHAIPVPRKIPISKSPLVSSSTPVHKVQTQNLSANSIIDTEVKKENIQDEKLASQPDRSKINIFKRISNKSKEEKMFTESEKQLETTVSNRPSPVRSNKIENEVVRVKNNAVVNNNDNSAVDLSVHMDLRANEVIDIEDDSVDRSVLRANPLHIENFPNITINKSLQLQHPKELVNMNPQVIGPKIKKDRKHKEKKDKEAEKTAKLQAKLFKKKQQQIAKEIAQMEKQNMKMASMKAKKESRPRESKFPQMPPGFPFFPGMMDGPGLIPGGDLLAGFANNPALRGLPNPNLLNPFAMGPAASGLIPGHNFLQGTLGSGMPNPLIPLGNFPHTSRSTSNKYPPMMRRPSLEVIPLDNDSDRGMRKNPLIPRDKDRHDKYKTPNIPHILQKHKMKSHKEMKTNQLKMPPVQPDITIELNPPRVELQKQEVFHQQPKEILSPSKHSPSPDPVLSKPFQDIKEEEIATPIPATPPINDSFLNKEIEKAERKKDKSHKKEKKDKDILKIKKKKDKKDKSKEKPDKKKEKEEKQEIKDRIKKEKKEKKKEKAIDGLVPKITLKLNSSNPNSPMPPSSPDTFKLNIKPVVKKDEEEHTVVKENPVSREHSRSPELAQISALVTRPPKQKHLKNHVTETEGPSPPQSAGNSPSRKPTPCHSKYKRILFKPMAKKGHVEPFDDDISISEEGVPPLPPVKKTVGPLPTPYYVDEHGNKIWVCPACSQPDNGSPMIGCDGCDCWYHWVCVGITEEPGATEDWFCKSCLAKRAAMALAGVTQSGKKRGRKPKIDKNRDCN